MTASAAPEADAVELVADVGVAVELSCCSEVTFDAEDDIVVDFDNVDDGIDDDVFAAFVGITLDAVFESDVLTLAAFDGEIGVAAIGDNEGAFAAREDAEDEDDTSVDVPVFKYDATSSER